MTAGLDCYWMSLCLSFRNRQTDLVYSRLLQSFPPVCFKDPLDSCTNHTCQKPFRSPAGHSGSLKKMNATLSRFQADIVSFSPSNPNHPPPLCVYVPQHILYCVYVSSSYTHTHTVSDLCATGDHGCEQVCISSPGSYKCACKDGFTLMDDGRSCSGECVRACVSVCVCVCVRKYSSMHSHCAPRVSSPVMCVTSPACSNSATDVVFLIDGSKSVRPENFELVKKWINQIVDKLEVSESKAHVGQVQYSSTVRQVRSAFCVPW